jgi:hypothetical protein
MKNKITLLTLAALVVFSSSSCFISLRGGRASRPHHGDRDYIEPLKNGMEHASTVPLKLHHPSQIPVCTPDDCAAD